MIHSSKADTTYSVSDFIEYRGTDTNTYYNFSIKEYLNGTEYFVNNIIYDYMDEINENAIVVKLSDVEKIKYAYKPWLLSMDIYGSTESSYIIKAMNNILSDNEFILDRVRLIHPEKISSVLGKIYSANISLLGYNTNKLKEEKFKDDIGNTVW